MVSAQASLRGATLIHGDCLTKMKAMPDRSVDLFLCDLPYGCLTNQPHADGSDGKSKGGKHYASRGFARPSHKGTNLERKLGILTAEGCAWDVKIDLAQFWVEVKRLCRDDHTPVLMFCSAKFGYDLIKSNEAWFRYDLVWQKTSAVGFLSANKMPMRSHELIYVFSKKGANYTRKDMEGKCVTSVVTIANKKGKGKHPTQKPDDLYEWLIERYSKEGDTVLDPTAGSFASVFTAHKMGRKAIGIEKDRTFFAKAIQASLVNLTDK